MASKAPNLDGRFVGVGGGFHGLLIHSGVFLALRWMVLEKVLRLGAVRRWSYLVTNPPHVRVMWTGHPTFYIVLSPVGVGLAHRVFSSGRILLARFPSLSLEELLPLWAHMPRLSGQGSELLY
jgi:hypothetical protein